MKLTNETLTLEASSTEETGIITEMIICTILGIEFNTKRNANFEIPEKMKEDIQSILSQEPTLLSSLNIKSHEGGKNTYYDFLTENGESLSLKTNTIGSKVCPQIIGQASLKTFAEKTKFKDIRTNDDYKKVIFDTTDDIVVEYLHNLFCCKYLLYFQYNTGSVILFEKTAEEVDLAEVLEYTFSQTLERWNESMTVSTPVGPLAEFQVHNNRNCLKCRFDVNTLLKLIEAGIIKNIKVTKKCLNYIYNIKIKRTPVPKALCKSGNSSKVKLGSFNYIGSKLKLLDFIEETITNYTGKSIADIYSFADLFAGTGVVSYHFLSNGCKSVVSSDIQHYAYIVSSVLTTTGINVPKLKAIIQDLNNLTQEYADDTDFVYNNYTEAGERLYLTSDNGLRVDKIRQSIEQLKQKGTLTPEEYNALLKVLLYAVTRVSNITSVYGAYLKAFKKTALKKVFLDDSILDTLLPGNFNHVSMLGSITSVIKRLDTSKIDVVYLDPPYNQRTYSANYHVLETISRYDNPILKGKTGLRSTEDAEDELSEAKLFCSKRTCSKEFERITSLIKSKFLFISYSSEGLISKQDFTTLLSKNWKNVVCREREYQRFTSRSLFRPPSKVLIEYLFCCKK
jgi:adenine-specific DNA-methyltransferase